VVKLDSSLIRGRPGRTAVATIHSVLDWAAANGSSVVAEGIETAAQLDLTRGYGIGFGQGYLLGRPGPLPDPLPLPAHSIGMVDQVFDRWRNSTPFAIVNSHQPRRRLDPVTVHELVCHLLGRAAGMDPAPAVFVV